jgi:hypothetical protein
MDKEVSEYEIIEEEEESENEEQEVQDQLQVNTHILSLF